MDTKQTERRLKDMADIGRYDKFKVDEFEDSMDCFDEDMAEWMHHFAMTWVESRELDRNDPKDSLAADMFSRYQERQQDGKGERMVINTLKPSPRLGKCGRL